MKSYSEIESIVTEILKKNKVKRSGFFGSILTQNFGEESDIDILVELDENTGLIGFIRLKHELEEKLQYKVDLVEYSALKPSIQQPVLAQEKRLYG